MSRALVAASWLLVVWGALAFGAVYAWAWRPLAAGSALVGAAAWVVARRRGARADDRALVTALGLVALAGCLQLVPLPRGLRLAVSPATETVLLEQNLAYAAAAQQDAALQTPEAAAVLAAYRPVSIDGAATARAIVLLSAFALLLGGLTRILNLTGARRLVTALVVFGAALALAGIIQRAVLGDHAYGGMKIYGFWQPRSLLTTPFGPFVNRNHFAGWMLMAAPLSMGLALGWGERARRRAGSGWRNALLRLGTHEVGQAQLAALALFVMAVALLMTRSRSGLGGLAAATLIAATVVSRRAGSRRAGSWIAAGLVLLLGAAFIWAGADVADRVAAGGSSLDLRRSIWHDSAAVLRAFPLAGTGLNTFGAAMLSYQTPPREMHFQEAHNDYLQVLVEGGLLVALPALGAVAALAFAIARRFRAGRDDGMTSWLRVGAVTGLSAIALQSTVEFSLQLPGNAVLCVVLMAIAIHEPPGRASSSQPPGGGARSR